MFHVRDSKKAGLGFFLYRGVVVSRFGHRGAGCLLQVSLRSDSSRLGGRPHQLLPTHCRRIQRSRVTNDRFSLFLVQFHVKFTIYFFIVSYSLIDSRQDKDRHVVIQPNNLTFSPFEICKYS